MASEIGHIAYSVEHRRLFEKVKRDVGFVVHYTWLSDCDRQRKAQNAFKAMESQMISVMNRIPVNPEYTEQFEARFSDRAALVDGMDGFVAFRLLRPSDPQDPYVVMTFWESQAHFEAWTNSAEFKQGHAQSGRLPREAFLGHPKIEVMEIIQEATAGNVLDE